MKFQIENYENMSVEEKLAALEAYEPDMSGFVAKSVADRHASEAADYKKKLREKQTEEEAKAQKDAEERAALEARVKELEHERAVNGYMAAYTAMGYDEKLAKASAEALAIGDTKTVFENQKAFHAAREKALRAEILKSTPTPDAGAPTAGVTKEAFNAMGYKERAALFNENPELYNQLNGGNE
jgi:hypothetical protein